MITITHIDAGIVRTRRGYHERHTGCNTVHELASHLEGLPSRY